MCFSPQGSAREYHKATKGWAILSLSPRWIRRERRREGRGDPLSTYTEKGKGRDWRKARFFFLLFLLKKK